MEPLMIFLATFFFVEKQDFCQFFLGFKSWNEGIMVLFGAKLRVFSLVFFAFLWISLRKNISKKK
jgi:hypothetical protein